MTQTVTGIVESVDTRQTSVGLMYNLKVNGKSYGYGKYAPKAKAGDTVTFGVVYRGEYANVDTKNIQVTPGTGAPPQAKTAPRATGGGMGKDDYWERKEVKDEARQTIISKQSALNSALAFVGMLQTGGWLPTAKTAKGSAEMLEELVAHYRDKFYLEATGVAMGGETVATGAGIEAAGIDDEPEEDSGW